MKLLRAHVSFVRRYAAFARELQRYSLEISFSGLFFKIGQALEYEDDVTDTLKEKIERHPFPRSVEKALSTPPLKIPWELTASFLKRQSRISGGDDGRKRACV